MSNSYVLLEKVVVGSAGASSVTFANIPQTGYTNLKVVMSARNTASASNWYTLKLQFNSDTTDGNYSTRILYGFGSTAGSGTGNRQNTGYITRAARTANTFNNLEMYIPNYAGNTNKSFSVDSVTEGNGSTVEILGFHAGLWSSTAAITQIVLAPDADNFVANSTFYLYGVAALGTTPTIAPKATGGDVIDTDGTYWYHIFRSSGTFTPATPLTCDYLVVAGGGGGGPTAGGGGGAGGYRTSIGGSPLSLVTSAYTVTIGAGGALNTIGADSVFSTITSTGGGRGGSSATGDIGGNGGSGGGGAGNSDGTFAGGSGNTPSTSPSQGNNGGSGQGTSGSRNGGGGGGATAVGGNGSTGSSTAGNGGAGTANSITGSSVTYAGGGGGGASAGTPGTGGAGGGGAGSQTAGTPTAGTANTGGGGGGGNAGAIGGSGIVVVRYLVA
jgi:hypothetical protein